jgi:hypothetical protein
VPNVARYAQPSKVSGVVVLAYWSCYSRSLGQLDTVAERTIVREVSVHEVVCKSCGGTGLVADSPLPGDVTVCRSCGATIVITPKSTIIKVEGADADEVEQVADRLAAEHGDAARRADAQIRGPWATGSFYLAVILILVAALLAAARLVPVWAFPVIVVGALLGTVVVGALQLRQDRLREEGFLELMRLTLARLPLLVGRKPRASP